MAESSNNALVVIDKNSNNNNNNIKILRIRNAKFFDLPTNVVLLFLNAVEMASTARTCKILRDESKEAAGFIMRYLLRRKFNGYARWVLPVPARVTPHLRQLWDMTRGARVMMMGGGNNRNKPNNRVNMVDLRDVLDLVSFIEREKIKLFASKKGTKKKSLKILRLLLMRPTRRSILT